MTTLKNALNEHEVRLFPSVSINSDKEAEMRATSAFLSVIKAVSEFGKAIIKEATGPSGSIECFTEVELTNAAKTKKSRPDGVIVVRRGKKEWKALVEVKVGSNGLSQEQFDRYQNLAKEYDLDALITISNQAALSNGFPPLKVDLRKVKKIPVFHFSWERLLSEAQMLSWQSGVSDIDQKYILDEWIRYVNDPGARIIIAPRVGAYWNELLSGAASDQILANKKGLEEFVDTWCGFLRIQAFRLRALLAEKVEVRYRGEEKKKPEAYTRRLVSEAVESNKIASSLVIPHTAGDLAVTIDLRSRRVFYEVEISPPRDKRTKGQLGWIVNQLRKIEESPSDSCLIVDWKKKGVLSRALIKGIDENRESLLLDLEKNLIPKELDIRTFKIQWATRLPRKKTDLFTSIGGNLETFYKSVVQNLTVYVQPTPKISEKKQPTPVPAASQPVVQSPTPINISSWWNSVK